MTYKDWDSPSWRDDDSLSRHNIYKRRWAILPVECSGGEKVWFKHYYTVHRLWSNKYVDEYDISNNNHRDFLGNITEAEYIVRKLAENL